MLSSILLKPYKSKLRNFKEKLTKAFLELAKVVTMYLYMMSIAWQKGGERPVYKREACYAIV
jgi:hypothetical protein